jgi:hypothetical protein
MSIKQSIIKNNNGFVYSDTDHKLKNKKIVWISDTKIQIVIDNKIYYGENDVVNIKIGDYVQLFKMSHYSCTNKINNNAYLSEI